MKRLALLLVALACASLAHAAPDADPPKAVAQGFYDAYMKVLRANGDTQKFVMSSETLTQSFKKAYAKLIKEGMESDPVICGQDLPDKGFAATDVTFKNGKAYVKMKSRGDDLKHSFTVTLREVDGEWLISDTNDLKADADD